MMNEIGDLLPHGVKLALGNTMPISPCDSSVFYYIEEGSVNVFLARRMPDGRTGARYLVCTAESGEIVFPLPGNETESFLEIGEQDTHIRILNVSDLEALYRKDDPDAQETADFALFIWFSKLAAKLSDSGSLGKKKVFVEAGHPVHMEKDSVFAAEAGTVSWLQPAGHAAYFNGEASSFSGSGTCIPLTSSIWARTLDACDITLCTTAQLADIQASVRLFHSVCSTMHIARKQAMIAGENERINKKYASGSERFSKTLGCFTTLLDDVPDAAFSAQYQPVIQAVMLVAERQKQKVVPPADKKYESSPDGLVEFAQDVNLRIRRVTLASNWYESDMGNLCGFAADENGDYVPVALIKKGCVYYIINAETAEKTVVNEETAQRLSSDAWCIYKGLPEKKLGLRDIMRFTMETGKKEIPVYLVLGLAVACFGLLLTKMMQMFYDDFIPQAAKNQMLAVVILLVVAQLVSLLFSMTQNFSLIRFITKSEVNLNSAVWDRLLRLPVDFFRDFTAGDLTDRCMMLQNIQDIIYNGVLANVVGSCFALVYFIQMFAFNKTLALAAVLITLAMMVISAVLCICSYRHKRRTISINNSISGLLLQFINGMAKLRITSSEKTAFGIWADKFIAEKREYYEAGRYDVLAKMILPVFPLVSMVILYALYPLAVKNSAQGSGMLTTGSFMAFMALFQTFQTALITMTTSVTQSLDVIPMYEQCRPILEAVPEINEAKERIMHLSGEIDIRHISFRYAPDLPFVLNDVSLDIHPGEFVAVVGASGSGKSTLMRMLLGFEHASSGSIFYDKQEINSLDITSIRRQIGVVLQTSMVVQGSIYENVSSTANLPVEAAWDALRMVGLEDEVKAMPMGIQTVLPTGGSTLSGGQRQRLIIARSLVRKPPILLLDEASSALDNKTQAVVAQSLENLHVTRIVVAHRLSTIIHADMIYVMENGQIVESGTYNQLMKNKKYFYELARRQSV